MKKKTINIILFSFIIASVVILFFYTKKSKINTLKTPKFTVGVITSEWHSKTTLKGPGYDFKYNIESQQYESTTNHPKSTFELGKKYLTIYDSLNIDFVNLLPIYPLPDSIKVPANGWKLDEIPIDVDWKRIEEYVLSR